MLGVVEVFLCHTSCVNTESLLVPGISGLVPGISS